jgi:arabinofuranan 3-O-arabinosyltransferase
VLPGIAVWQRMLSISRFEDRLFTARRLSVWGFGFLAAYVTAFLIRFLVHKWIIDKTGHPIFTDFVWIWVGGRFALVRDAAGLLNHSTFSKAQASLIGGPPPKGLPYFYWMYPPTILFIIAPFALLSYIPAFIVWLLTTAFLYIATIYAIVPCALAILLALLPCPVIINVSLGQASFLTTALLGVVFLLMDRRPYLAGICLGLLTYKPQFGVFFPLVLVICGQWRVIAGAVVSASLFCGAAAAVFGPWTWVSFARSLFTYSPGSFTPVFNVEVAHQTVFGMMHWLGAGVAAAWTLHLTIALLATAFVCAIWLRPAPYSLKAAAFSLGSLAATPYLLIYDLTALSVPVAFLVKDARERGFLPGERLVLMACFFVTFAFAYAPVAPVVVWCLMALVCRRVSYAPG